MYFPPRHIAPWLQVQFLYIYIVAGCKDHATRRAQFKAPEGGLYWKTGDYVSGDGALARRGALGRVQVNQCGARSGADRSHTAFWNIIERVLVCCLMERLLTLRWWACCLCARGLTSRRCGRSARDDLLTHIYIYICIYTHQPLY